MLGAKGLWYIEQINNRPAMKKRRAQTHAVASPATLEQMRLSYQSLTSHLARAAFLSYCLYARHRDIAVRTSIADVAAYLDATAAELEPVNPYELVDGIKLVETFNMAHSIIASYNASIEERNLAAYEREKLPDVFFHPMPWLYVAIAFIRTFDKTQYPLLFGWTDFILFLPQLRNYQASLYLGFSDYTQAVASGEFEKWYSFRRNHADKLARMDHEQLQSEYKCCSWGLLRLVWNEIQRRESTRMCI
jgi:hypothetical protein